LHTASDQKLNDGKVWEQGYLRMRLVKILFLIHPHNWMNYSIFWWKSLKYSIRILNLPFSLHFNNCMFKLFTTWLKLRPLCKVYVD